MITPVYHQYLDALFLAHWAKTCRKRSAGNDRRKTLEAVEFQVDEVAKALQTYPLHVFPDRESLIIYAKRLFDETPRIPRRPKTPPDNAVRILYSSRLRRSIECLALLKYERAEIELLLRNNDILDTEQEDSGVGVYLDWFFNITELPDPDKHLFFTEAQKVSYYSLHCAIFWGTIDDRIALTALDLAADAVSISDFIMQTIKMLMHQMQDAAFVRNLTHVQKYSQTLSQLANTYARLSGNSDEPQESLADYVRLIEPEPSPYKKTLEEIHEHNRIVQEYCKRNGNVDFSQLSDKLPPVSE
ncbi:MAG: hypothetical protein R3C41_13425 [Calditrichia bacterium]|nr:hypothetical protein [Calditrichota bacterium]MCB9067178.1 hypothetical protein [Calditrichia bacterium]